MKNDKPAGFDTKGCGGNREEEAERLKQCLDEFNNRFPTETECIIALELILAAGRTCKYCQFENPPSGSGKRTFACRNCKKKIWLTSGSFFANARRLRPWFAAIWISEHGLAISAFKFQFLLAVVYATAWGIFRKLNIIVGREPMSGFAEIPSLLFSEAIGKRSRETPARLHPCTEEDVYAEQGHDTAYGAAKDANNHPDHDQFYEQEHGVDSVIIDDITDKSQDDPQTSAFPEAISIDRTDSSGCQISNEEQFLLSLIPDGETHFDELQRITNLPPGELTSLLTMLEISGKVTGTSNWKYKRSEYQTQDKQDAKSRIQAATGVEEQIRIPLASFIEFVQENFHRISRKYLQMYLAAYWCKVDPKFWRAGALFSACLRSKPISDAEILNYVSPRMVKIWAA